MAYENVATPSQLGYFVLLLGDRPVLKQERPLSPQPLVTILLRFVSFGKKIMEKIVINVPHGLEINPSAELALKLGDCDLGLHIYPLESRSTSFFTLFDGSNKLGYIKCLA